MILFRLYLSVALTVAATGCSPATVSRQHREASAQKLEKQVSDERPDVLPSRIGAVLYEGLYGRQLNVAENAAWQIMHGVISYGAELQIDTPDRGLVSAVEYAFTGGLIQGFELMPGVETLPSTGRPGLKARLEPGSYVGQGHVDQWLAVFAMAELPLDLKIQAGGREFTLLDWARQAQYDVSRNPLDEFSWTLIALTHYFPDEPTWRTADGSMVSWELLVKAELTYDIDLSPCGGTHRLAGLTRAVQAKERLSLSDSPTWDQARATIQRCLANAQTNRAADGSLSSNHFVRPGSTADLSSMLASSGHLLEFVSLAVPQEEISAAWIELAVNRVCSLLEASSQVELDCGALYHALNGLKIYQRRRYLIE